MYLFLECIHTLFDVVEFLRLRFFRKDSSDIYLVRKSIIDIIQFVFS